MSKKLKKSFWIFMKGWGYSIIIAIIIATSFKSAVAEMNQVPTGSMNPTILEGDRIFVNKLAYDLKIPYTTIHIAEWDNPERGDIAVLYSPEDGERLVKRVIGIPGDRIEMKNNRLVINGKELVYKPVSKADKERMHSTYIENLDTKQHPIYTTPRRSSPFATFGPITIPDNKYLMMGDNRDNSRDSRYFGLADRNQIIGRASSVVYSLNIFDRYKPRWDRFFTKLQ